ncbi:D-alanyl-D-alanine carboxypeptidase family protein [Sphingomonas pituitosa]|uniref:D-alanyl-D-alanine carboxypeptidase family protein n=1 Tax=Sphingomonas pituitosa TaxID=99597 RepID=UPI0008326657|nr:D-alanyl-D-alanine carboxypeptidase family protein [Sphingomonas pituitosa]
MDDGSPALEVGFNIDFGDSFGNLRSLDDILGETAANAVREFNKMKAASGSALDLSGATASVSTFATATTRAFRTAKAESQAAERAGESLVRQLERQIETFGKTASEIRNMRAEQRALNAEQQGLTQLAGDIRALNAEMVRLETAGNGSAKAVRGNGSALAAISPQAQDAFTQISMGTNVLNVLAIQGGQAAGQMIYLGGTAEKFGKFMLGPWGLALTAGMLVAGALTEQILKHNNALNDAVDKLKKDAAETELNRQAKERFKTTAEGVAAAIREGTQATRDAIAAQKTSAEQDNINAKNNLAREVSIRRVTLAQIEQAQVLANNAKPTSGPGGADSIVAAQYAARVVELKRQAEEQQKLIDAAESRIGETRIALAEEVAKRMADPSERIKKQYDDQAAAAKNAARAQTAAGGALSTALAGQLANQLAQIERNRQAALKAEQDRQSAMKQTAQVGRDIDLAEARRIAQSIGARITSEQRSYAEQKALYDKYMAYKAGKGPWAALAAAPGSSAHETGNALDIAKTPGMSLAKIREAYRAAGVSIRQLLDEGDHFHIAWKKGADSAAAASKKLADTQADLAKKFDPAASAALEYQAALKSIADAKLDPETAARYGKAAAEAFRKARAAAFELPSMSEISVQAEADKAAEKSAEEFGRNVLQPLRDELALYGLVGAARAKAALDLEKESFIAKNIADGADVAAARWKEYYALKSQLIEKDAALEAQESAARRLQEDLALTADGWDTVARSVQNASRGMADAFGDVGQAIGDMAAIYANYQADSARADAQHLARLRAIKEAGGGQARIDRENAKFALSNATAQIGVYGDMASAAKGFFSENSKGYEILAATEKAYRAIQFAMSVRAMAQDVAETLGIVSNSAARATAQGTEGIAAQSKLPFPFNIVAMAATAGALVAAGVAVIGSLTGGGAKQAPTNTGTGTVLGDASAKSESLKRAIDELKAVDTVTNVYSRQMLASLKSIDSQISGVASVIVRGGDINASGGVAQGFKPNLIGSVLGAIPVVGGLLSSLFGTRTDVTGSGIYGGAQSLGSVLNGGFNGQAYSDVTKTKKFLGIVSGRSYSTQYGALDPSLSNQFTLILRSFNDAIKAAAVPLGASTDAIQQRLNGFVVNIGKIDLKGLTGEQIQEKLNAVFGAAADNMATAAFPLIAQFQKVGEGAFETLTRVATTVEQVSTSLDLLGASTRGMGIAAKLGLADQFDSVSALNDAATAYFQAFYTSEEQAAAKTAQMSKVFASLGVSVPPTLASFRQLVEAQDLTTTAGQATYATLLKLAPAFADLQQSLQGAKSAADVMSERQDLERQILELQGKTDEIRKLDLAKLDASNRALQLQVWAIQDAQEAAKAADELRQAWSTVGDSIMDEVKRIRGLGDVTGSTTYAGLLGQFNAASAAARGGDQDAAKSLPQLSQALLSAAASAATSRQELARVQAQTAASLEATYGAINKLGTAATATSNAALLSAAATAQTATSGSNDNPATIADLRTALAALTDEVKQLRTDNNAGHAATAGNTGKTAKILDTATQAAGGAAIGTKAVA